jgi:hypothetical protein
MDAEEIHLWDFLLFRMISSRYYKKRLSEKPSIDCGFNERQDFIS